VTKPQTTSLQAYDLLLRGRFYFDKGGTQNRKRAIEYFKQAIGIDRNYAAAYAALSNAYRTLVFSGVLAPEEFLSEAEKAARTSLDLDDGLAEGHEALSSHMRATWDWSGAERESRRAILLNANLASAHGGRATFLSLMARHDEAIAEAERALELDPLSGDLTTRIALCLLFARRYDRALAAAAHAIKIDPSNSVAFLFRGYAYAAKGLPLDAIKAYEDAIRVGDETPSTQIYLGAAYAQSGSRAAAEAILKRLQADRDTYVSPGELPVLLSALGRTEEAFASLERAFAVRDVQLSFLGVDPALDGLRGDPRFAALMRRVGLLR
jgi:tetratricopeptide (TPR) repeat protein